uniref:Uncharacterized protein n=1 Tax=viral metagenome TaxID=1070528 RepID=A0A6C0IA54_9ZZZZ
MLFDNYNIDNIPVIKQICKDILGGFMATRDTFNITEECNLLTDYIRDVISRKSKLEKDNAIKSMSNIYEDAYYNKLMEKMGDYYDVSDPLLIICDNIIRNHYEKIFMYGWENNIYGVWSRKKMLEEYNNI